MRKVTTFIPNEQEFAHFCAIFVIFLAISSLFCTFAAVMIGVFDSGYGGLTILKHIRRLLPEYDYLYLGDNARAPYGTRSYEVIYEYTLQAVRYLASAGCRLILLACNTASAKALRSIQMHDIDPDRLRVLGVIRPTAEAVFNCAFAPSADRQERHIGVLATEGTVNSTSYIIELCKQWRPERDEDEILTMPDQQSTLRYHGLNITQQACPLWVPIIEAGEQDEAGAAWFINKYIESLVRRDPDIDTILLACTHYPIIQDKIQAVLQTLYNDEPWLNGKKVPTVMSQGEIVSDSLKDYLFRHPEIERTCSRGGTCTFLTTERTDKFDSAASLFLGHNVNSKTIEL